MTTNGWSISHRWIFVFTLLSIGVLTACSSRTSTTATTSSPLSTNSVTMSNFTFSPATLTVAAGTVVIWTNQDSVTHTVQSDTGVFESGNIAPNATFQYKFDTPGSFGYHCSPHPFMKGTIVVQ
jgi:plastocyanin